MAEIRVLDKHTAELIAAGEVVERPASVAKELLENAIDAGATQITLSAARGGIAQLQIADNGTGIEAEYIDKAFIRHATSKIATADDLGHIHTLGFRGEALASIASVAKVEVLTRTETDEYACCYRIEGGEPQGMEPGARPVGTTITVNDLCSAADLNRGTFYNHFRDKEHLLESFEDEVMRDLVAIQAQMESIDIKEVVAARFTKRPLPFLVDLFDYLSKQGAFLHAVLGPGGDIRFGPRLRDSVCAHLIQSVLHEQYRNDPTAFVDYYLAFYASAYLGVITHWIETGMKESSEEMALIAMRLLFIRPGEPIRM